jgi:hypothetical protein
VSRTKISWAVPKHRFFAREVEDQDSGNLTLNHFPVEDRSTNHRFDLNIGHDSSMRTSSRSRSRGGVKVENGFFVFHFCTAHAGCESAQSIQRSSLRRPGAPAGCSRCERSLDTVSACVASSRVVPLISAPPPLSPHLSASGGSSYRTQPRVTHTVAIKTPATIPLI